MAARSRRASRVTREAIKAQTAPIAEVDVSPKQPAVEPEPEAVEETKATTKKTTPKKAT